MRIKSLPENERPMEKMCRHGTDKLSNAELIALILHSGTRDKSAIGLGEDVLAMCPEGLAGLGTCCLEDLLHIGGIGKTKACALLAALELGKRMSALPSAEKVSIDSAEDVARLFMEEMRHLKKEHFRNVLVNTKGEIITVDDVSIGELSSTIVHPREVFHMAVRKSAAAVIFVHNHPSGDSLPSQEDRHTTRRLMESGELLGIRVLDHIIIGDGEFSSMRGMGLMD